MDNKALGKGLSALISSATDRAKVEDALGQMRDKVKELEEPFKNMRFTPMSTEMISNNPFQPRQNYNQESLEELKASIKEKGILQPILVRPKNGGGFEVVAGERRLRAAKALGIPNVPVVVKEMADTEVLLLALIENIQRQDLNVIDEAKAFDRLAKEFQLSQDQIATSVGKDRATVSNTMRLLKLPAAIQDKIVQEEISMGHARALLALESEEAQLKMAEQIIKQELSVRSVEGLVQQATSKALKKTKAQKLKDPDIVSLEDELRKILGTKVIVEDKKGKGRLVVEYYSLDDLDRILAILRKNSVGQTLQGY
ncbi:MAG: ParB/RepB/Spo0J family partition protein [Candidatus Omnitrophota bacterium]